jgi:hypothetical protein
MTKLKSGKNEKIFVREEKSLAGLAPGLERISSNS